MRQMAEPAAQPIVRGNATDRKATAMKIHQHRQHFCVGGIQAHRHGIAIARRKSKTFHALQALFGQLQNASSRFVSGAGLGRA